jgi:hypothetical protein
LVRGHDNVIGSMGSTVNGGAPTPATEYLPHGVRSVIRADAVRSPTVRLTGRCLGGAGARRHQTSRQRRPGPHSRIGHELLQRDRDAPAAELLGMRLTHHRVRHRAPALAVRDRAALCRPRCGRQALSAAAMSSTLIPSPVSLVKHRCQISGASCERSPHIVRPGTPSGRVADAARANAGPASPDPIRPRPTVPGPARRPGARPRR